MSIANKLISLGTKINAAKTHCNEALVAKGGTEASTLWEVGDRIGEISSGNGNNYALIDLIERDIMLITIPDSVTSIGSYAFYYCPTLTSVTIPDSVTSIGQDAFYNCDSLTAISIPDSMTSIGDSAFSNCSNLATVTFGENSQLTSIGNSAFRDCDSLATVTFSENSQLERIDASAFRSCTSLTSVTIPDSMTSIGEYAFAFCTALTSIIIPYGVTKISASTFYNCASLTSLILKSNYILTVTNTSAFAYTPIASGTGYIYVPRALLSEYQSATNWSTYASQFRAIEDYPDIVGG